MRRQVAGEEDQIRFFLYTRERFPDPLPGRFRGVHVTRCCDPDHGSMLRVPVRRETGLSMANALDPDFRGLLEAMKKAGGVLNDAGVPWVLGGGLACWARGGPETEHDVDFLI